VSTDADPLEQQVIAIIATKKKIDPQAITPTSTFEELGLDSLDAADLIFTVEDTFKILVPDESAQSMRSVGDVIAGIRQLVEADGAGAR
jgi:acyl carrier protein